MKKIFNIILFLFKLILQSIITIGIFLLLLVFLINSLFTSLPYRYREEKIIVEDNSFLKLNFAEELNEKVSSSYFGGEASTNFYSTLEGIEAAANDDKIKGIYLLLDNVALNSNHVEEIGESLEKFKKSGKKVYAFTRNLNNKNYSLGIYADVLSMPPTNSAFINISGYYKEFNYFKGLSDYLGVKFNVIHVGDYKSYGEQYSKEEMSKTFKENVKRIYNKTYDYEISNISKKRSLDRKTLEDTILGGYLVYPNIALVKSIGIIDGNEYEEEFKEKYNIENIVHLKNYLTTLKKKDNTKQIAIIYADGEILDFQSSPKNNAVTLHTIKEELKIANENDKVKGVVLRINSPGGSALTSELIHHELSKINKPIYVSMGKSAASGGYYISTGTDKIFATKSTITGSIGVVSIIPNITELLNNSKINVESIEKGKYSGIYSISKKMSEDEFNKIKSSSTEIYNEFKNRVSVGRGISLDDVENIANGQIWMGEEGVENGLVDEIGGLKTTISALANELNLKSYQVIEINKKKSLYDTFLDIEFIVSNFANFLDFPTKESVPIKYKIPLLLLPYDLN